MKTETGFVAGVNGNLINVDFDGSVRKNEVGYILVEGKRLKGEVIRINNGIVSMQIYEMTVCSIRCRSWQRNVVSSWREASIWMPSPTATGISPRLSKRGML